LHDRDRTGEADEQRMVALFFARRREGLEAVYEAFGATLYSLARSVLGGDADAQDCVHDVLLRAWQRPRAFQSARGSLRAYLMACVRNEAIGRKRSAARHFRIEERLFKSERRDYEIEVRDHVETDRLRRVIAALPAEQRIAVELAYFGHLSQAEIADKLQAPLGTIKSRVALALRKLRLAMGDPAEATR
jgi:RNA polymerase sigma-70 factor (ECF subfamily)